MGYSLPEEAEPHARTFMQWPVSRRVHPDIYFLRDLQNAVADTANTIAEFEPVVMMMDRKHAGKARKKLSDAVEIWDIPTEDLWCRDSGPVFVRNNAGDLAITQMNFNGWGGKQVHKHDGKIAKRVAGELGLRVFDNGLVGEGGGVESNGKGTLIAHASSWVIPNRNAGSRATVEQQLLEALGARKMIWAPGIAGEDITDYHIDALARFVSHDTVLIQLPDRIRDEDPWSAAAYQTRNILANSTNAEGQPLKLLEIPEPVNPRVRSLDFVASYVNYYVCNGAVISAQFGDRDTDQEAISVLADAYPDREIVTLNVDPIGEIGGGIHCATQQQPTSG